MSDPRWRAEDEFETDENERPLLAHEKLIGELRDRVKWLEGENERLRGALSAAAFRVAYSVGCDGFVMEGADIDG
jgi:hypothetical protein